MARAICSSSIKGPSTSQLSMSQEMALLWWLCWAAWTLPVLPLCCFFLSLRSFKRAIISPSCSIFSPSPWDERPWKGDFWNTMQQLLPSSSPGCVWLNMPQEPGPEEIKGCWGFHASQSTNEDTSLIRDWFSCSTLSMLLLFSQRDFGKWEHKRSVIYRADSSGSQMLHCFQMHLFGAMVQSSGQFG